MSSREPMWYCHECNAEMRPLMMPDPHCASCRGTFVEKMENPEDDPRTFNHGPPFMPGGNLDGNMPEGADNFFALFDALLSQPRPGLQAGRPRSPGSSEQLGRSQGRGFRFELGGDNSGRTQRTFVFGGPNTLGRSRDNNSVDGDGAPGPAPMNMSEFLRREPGNTGGDAGVPIQMMAHYIMNILAQRPGGSPIGPFGPGMEGGGGAMGDYVFGQDAFNQVLSQLLENANDHRPVPATDDITANLPRTVLEDKSPLLENDCAVCKEQFKLETEDPDEQVVVTLPCKHPFHEPCIMPWLKSSGTCPVCRYQLVAQPTGHAPPGTTPPGGSSQGGSGGSGPGGGPREPSSAPNDQRSPGPGGGDGILGTLMGYMSGNHGRGNSAGSEGDGRFGNGRTSGVTPGDTRSNQNQGRTSPPGGWRDDLD